MGKNEVKATMAEPKGMNTPLEEHELAALRAQVADVIARCEAFVADHPTLPVMTGLTHEEYRAVYDRWTVAVWEHAGVAKVLAWLREATR